MSTRPHSTIDFTFKLHALHQAGGSDWTFSSHFAAALSEQERVSTLWWEGELSAREQLFDGVPALVEWLKTPVGAHFDPGRARPGGRARLGRRLRRVRSSP